MRHNGWDDKSTAKAKTARHFLKQFNTSWPCRKTNHAELAAKSTMEKPKPVNWPHIPSSNLTTTHPLKLETHPHASQKPQNKGNLISTAVSASARVL